MSLDLRPSEAVYETFLEQLEHKLCPDATAKQHADVMGGGVHRQVLQLLKSFGDFSRVESSNSIRIEEWNPISQRPVIPAAELKFDDLDQDFESQANGVRCYIGTAHELAHCLLWEPFFSGALLPTKARFAEVSLAFEAFCFWHSDIVLTPQVRALTPDNELVHDRNCLSQVHFHPYRAFKALGLDNDLHAILGIYLAAFTGHRTALHDSTDLFARNLARRTVQLYITHMRSLPSLFGELKKIGTFGSFYRRFCAKPGMPVLFRAPIDACERTFDYCHWVAQAGWDQACSRDEVALVAVRARRRVQTRAYHAFQLLALLRRGQVVSTARRGTVRSAAKSLEAELGRYLDSLEDALAMLCRSEALESIESQVAAADDHYENRVRKVLREADLWVSARTLILGPTPKALRSGDAVVVGCKDWLSGATPRSIGKLVELLVGEYLQRLCRNLVKSDQYERQLADALALASSIVRGHEAFRLDSSCDRTPLICAINRFLCMEQVLPMWSVCLSSISPATGRFRELSFMFE